MTIDLNKSWFIFYGLQLGLPREDTLMMRYGEFMDLLACQQIYSGAASVKKTNWTFDEFIALK